MNLSQRHEFETLSSLKKKIAYGGGWTLAARLTALVGSFVLSIILARLLPVEKVGYFNLARSFVWGASILVNLGLSQAVVKIVSSRYQAEPLSSVKGVIVKSLKSVLLFFIVFAAVYYAVFQKILFQKFDSAQMSAVIVILVLMWVGLFSLQTFLAGVLQGLREIRFSAFLNESFSALIVVIVLVVFWLARSEISLSLVFSIFVCSLLLVVSYAFSHLLWKMRGVAQDRNAISYRELLDLSGPLFLSTLAVYLLTQSDIWILNQFSTPENVGVYSLSFRLAMTLTIFPTVVNWVVSPYIAKLFSQGDRESLEKVIRTAGLFSFFPSLALVLIFFFEGQHLLTLLFGSPYQSGYLPLLILAFGHLTTAFVGSASYALTMTGHHKAFMKASVMFCMLTIALSTALVGSFDMVGVAIGACIGNASFQLFLMFYVKKRLNMWTFFQWRQLFTLPKLVRHIVFEK